MSTNQNNTTKSENLEQEIFDNEETNGAVSSEENVEDTLEISEVDALKKQLEGATTEVEKQKKEYLFLMAEFDNFRKRTIKEKGEIIRNASESAMKGILPIIDDFERGLDALKNTTDAEAVKEGMSLIYNKLLKYLEANGVKAIESNGADFDAELHEAIALIPTEDASLKGKVIDTPTKGYTINGDKVLRFAKVAVGQ